MRMQVKLEIGHKAACRSAPTSEGFTHDWTVFVRGSEGKEISHFVEKVIFHLHESFPKPKRAIKEPPYKLDESGYGSFELKIEVCFKTKDEPRRVHFTYDLFLPLSGLPPVTSVRTEALTFTHPTEDFMKKLVKGGGIPISTVNGVSNGVSNGHPAPREESKESTTRLLSNIPENEKSKKIKMPKTSSKPTSAVVGMKRSPPLLEPSQQAITDGVPKKKKKSSEGSSSTKIKHTQGDSVMVPASQPLTTEVKDLKVKFKPVAPKENVEKDKKKDSVGDSHKSKSLHTSKTKETKSHKTEQESKKLGTSEHKIKVKKKGEKSEKKREKKDKSKSKKDKIEKVTIRRSSGDSWASSGGLMSNVFAKNKALGKMLSEMSSDEEEGDIIATPFKHESSSVSSKITQKEKATLPTPFKHGITTCHKEKSDIVAGSKCELSEDFTESRHKEQISKKNIVNISKSKDNASHEDNNVDNEIEEQHSPAIDSMDTSSTMENGISNEEKVIDDNLSNKELYDLYEQISNSQDGEFLQKVVDVIETTGLYTVAEKTFEFDLCCLGKATLKQLQKCLGIT